MSSIRSIRKSAGLFLYGMDFITIIRGIFLKGVGIAELWTQALALVILGVTILTLSVLRFRKKLG